MDTNIYSVITGTGSHVPSERVPNEDFFDRQFYDAKGDRIRRDGKEIVEKFEAITTIKERRYVPDHLVTSDIAYLAAKEAIASAKTNKEELDYIILAHNFGDVKHCNRRSDMVPTLAARVKYKLGISNPYTVAYDLPFGCPGWLQAVIQANYFIKSGDARKILVIGAEVLSRVCDPHDRDSMLYADGAGAVVLEAKNSTNPVGILAHKTRSDTLNHSHMLYMGTSYDSASNGQDPIYLKMNGRKLYQYALEKVPGAIKNCLDETGISHTQIKKLLIHQANGKMDEAILTRFYGQYEENQIPGNIMPMTVSCLGNSSVATIPTLLDLIMKGNLQPHEISGGDVLVFASVGAGMNINAMVYRA